ncbi:MAG TPA: hypothetical protein VFZ12_04850 [Dehalococcoidia bacterium]|nr:hypothetical protein [Dehalococcoidia bacterium]
MHQTRLLPAALTIGLALLAAGTLAACGGDDDDADVAESVEEEVEDAGDEDDGDATPIGDEEVESDDPVEDDDDAADDAVEGGDDDDDAGEVCSLLTIEEAESLLEEAVSDPEGGSTTPIFDVCSWAAEAVDSFSIIVLQVLTDDFPGGAEDFYNSTIEGLQNEEFEEISGLGDEAVYYAGLLQVREGDNLIALSVTIDGSDEETNKAKTEEAAEIVLDRLD